MAESLVAPIAEPIVDTIYDFESTAVDFAESLVADITDSVPAAERIGASAIEFVRKAFDFQRDLSKRIIDTVDDTISGVGDVAADAAETAASAVNPDQAKTTKTSTATKTKS